MLTLKMIAEAWNSGQLFSVANDHKFACILIVVDFLPLI
jgi:hypothetical protein